MKNAAKVILFKARKNLMKPGLLGLLVLNLGLLLPAKAQAGCDDLENNDEWNAAMKSVIDDYSAGNYKEAHNTAKWLSEEICAESPLLLYTQGKIFAAMGDENKARFYYQKASETTYKFAVTPDMAQKIWNARYESEHPDRTEKSVEEKNKKIEALEKDVNRLTAKNIELSSRTESDFSELNYHEKSSKTVMWVGVGTGIAGLALLTTGVILVAQNLDKPASFEKDTTNPYHSKYKVRDAYSGGWAVTGSGIALTVLGTALAGYFGYKFTHINKSESSSESEEMTLSLTPSGAAFSMTF